MIVDTDSDEVAAGRTTSGHYDDELGVELSEREKKNPRQGSHVLTFPGDVSVVVKDKAEYVTLPRSELEGMVKREEVEVLQELVHHERQEREAMAKQGKELEALVKTFLGNNQGSAKMTSTGANENTRRSAQVKEELLGLVNSRSKEMAPEDTDEWHAPFGETIYTCIYMCSSTSQSFWYSIFVYGLQIATISLTLVDIVDAGSFDNPLRLPPMVDPTVTIAQGVTIFIALAYQSDLIEAVLKLQDGFYPEILVEHPDATFATWLLSCLAQLWAGLLLMATIFILTMQVDTVLAIMLNFAALHFMADLDDLGFALARMGFVTNQLQLEVQSVADVQVPKRPARNVHRRILYSLTMIGLFIGYGILKKRQLDGQYLPTYIYVQFGDSYNPKIPYYSDILTSGNVRTARHREYRDLGSENILLAFCDSKKSWTFSDSGNPCDYFAISSETDSYDVTTLADSEWQIKDTLKRLQPFESFSLVSRDCDPDTCQGNCSSGGLCQCEHDRFGMDCEFSNICPELVLDGASESFPITTQTGGNFGVGVEEVLALLKNSATGEFVRVYNMPVYYSTTQTAPATVIFFGGRRWIIAHEWDLINVTEENQNSTAFFPEQTAAFLSTEFHAHFQATFTPLFLSDPVDYETPDFRPTPSGIGWSSVRVVNSTTRHFAPGSQVVSAFNCKTCDADQGEFCGVHGLCNQTTGICDCLWGYHGAKCEEQIPCYNQEMPCYGDGVCDQVSGACRCNAPYSGKLCEFTAECTHDLGCCQNGGICNMTPSLCDCPVEDPAIGSFSCEKFADCHVYGCANGGVCALNGKCICRPPFHGILCNLVNETQEEFLCSGDNPCLDGLCNNETGTCICSNPSSYGTLCEHQYSCTWGGCLNSGECNEVTGLCECPFPFFGPDCAQEPVCFEDSYCEEVYGPGSICETSKGVCKCGRNKWQVGKKCTTCKTKGCYNGGVCNECGHCDCPTPYTGWHCDCLAEDAGEDNGMLEQVGACIQHHGFPPYTNGTDCREHFHQP